MVSIRWYLGFLKGLLGDAGLNQRWLPHLALVKKLFHGSWRTVCSSRSAPHGSFYKLEVLLVGVLVWYALPFWVCVQVPDFWKLPCRNSREPTKHVVLVVEGMEKDVSTRMISTKPLVDSSMIHRLHTRFAHPG